MSGEQSVVSKKPQGPHALRGISLIEVVVGVSIMTVVFLGIFGAFKLSIDLVFSTKTKIGAVALLTERMEYIRSLPYTSVGTVGGIPAGPVLQLEQVTLNGTVYTLRTFIQYTDAPEDGLGTADENSITADYKTVKVEVLWSVRDAPRTTSAVTYATPVGLETLDSGGTLQVNVFDALTQPVPQASVRIVNAAVQPAVDVTALTNASGVTSFPGALEGAGYEITVTKPGYSTAKTYSVTAQNPNPSPNHVSVASGDTSTASFAIDTLGSLTVSSYTPPGPGSFSDTFTNQSKLFATSSVTAAGGALVLEKTDGVYVLSGNAFSLPTSPTNLTAWDQLSFTASTSANTSATVRLYYFDGSVYSLVPDTDLPNNSTGLSGGTTDLSALSTATYASLQLGVLLETANSAETPELLDWSVSYSAGPDPLPNIAFSIFGNKTVGTTGGGAPVYKFADSFITDQSGRSVLSAVEWDAYTLTLDDPLYDIAELCPRAVSVLPGQNLEVSALLASASPDSLRVVVESNGAPVADAGVALSGGVVVGNETSSACGQAYFGNLPPTTYTITITKAGYQVHTEDVAVSGDATLVAPLTGI